MNLYHHGIKGQKWGVRRYQNEDGSLTEAGKRRYRYQLYQNKDGTLNERGVKNYINKKGQLTKRGIKVYEEIGRRTVNDRTDKLLMEKGLRSLNGDDYLKKELSLEELQGLMMLSTIKESMCTLPIGTETSILVSLMMECWVQKATLQNLNTN